MYLLGDIVVSALGIERSEEENAEPAPSACHH
jgi:hypothetical protein